MYRLGTPGDEDIWATTEHIHACVYEILNTDSSTPYLFAGMAASAPEVFVSLATCLTPPYFLLYILHTPRGEGAEGRYQSPELSADALRLFVTDYAAFLTGDGRFDLWAYSPAEKATVVWDRHNYLFGYGPLERFADTLHELGYVPGAVDRIASRPHSHHYREEFDDQALAVLDRFDWTYSPLHDADLQGEPA